MSLSRKFLAALGIEAEKIDEIISAHTETVDSLKEQRDGYKADAEKLADVQKKLDDALKLVETYKADANKLAEIQDEYTKLKEASEKDSGFEKKYTDLKNEYDKYKKDQETKAVKEAKENAYKKLLTDTGVSSKRLSAILKVTNFDDIQMDEKGEIKDSDKLKESIKKEWADFIVSEDTKGADVSNPPKRTDGKLSKEDILKIQDPVERQSKIAENHELFGI